MFRRPAIAVKLRRRRQYAAIPMVGGPDGCLQVLLITSRQSRRWVLPKGWAEPGVAPHEQAACEAFEEAGVRGEISRERLGTYQYAKQLRSGRAIPVRVDVFPLMVAERLDDWPEKGQREAVWVPPAEAATMVEESGLVAILLDLAARQR